MTSTGTVATTFPEPYLQPDRTQDCGFYAQAYIARCLGHPDVTADQVKAWRAETSRHETYFADGALGEVVRRFWDEGEQESLGVKQRSWFWLGPALHGWVRGHLFTGWIAQVNVHRIQPMGHAVVLLGCTPEGVQIMDPICGHVTEPWEWFLGPGPRDGRGEDEWPGAAPDGRPWYGCHFIEGWYKSAAAVEADGARHSELRQRVVTARRGADATPEWPGGDA